MDYKQHLVNCPWSNCSTCDKAYCIIMNHEHDWRFDELQTKAYCMCGKVSCHMFWEQVDKGNIKDRWRN